MVRSMPGHEDEEEEEDEPDDEDKRKVMAPIKVRKPVEPGSVVAVAEAIIREVQERVVEPVFVPEPGVPAVPVAIPEWVPVPSELVVPDLYPTPVEVPGLVTPGGLGGGFVPSTPWEATTPSSPTLPVAPDPTERVGVKITAMIIAAGIGVAMAVVTRNPAFVERIVAISRILEGIRRGKSIGAIGEMLARPLSAPLPQAGFITPRVTAGVLRTTAAATIVRSIVSRTPDQPVQEIVRATIEKVVVDYVYPTAGQRSVAISKALAVAGANREEAPTGQPGVVGDASVVGVPFDYDSTVSPAGGHGYMYDFGKYLSDSLQPSTDTMPPPPE